MGFVIGGRFVAEQLAAVGGLGAIYRARDTQTDRLVAVKLGLRSDERDLMLRFEREAIALAQLDHPHIVRYVAHGIDARGFYLAMEWLDGEDLAQRLRRGPLEQSDALAMVQQLTSALHAAHDAGVVHRDLKPSNIFLCQGEAVDARLVDFGIARLADRTVLTQTDARPGTPSYMSPEQVRSGQRVSSETDIYSLGLVLFEALTGQRVFESEDVLQTLARIVLDETPRLSQALPAIAPAIDRLTYRMMARDASARPTAAQVLECLSQQSSGSEDDQPPLLGLAERPLVAVVTARPPLSLCPPDDSSDATVANASAVASDLRRDLSRLSVELDTLSDGSVLGVLLPEDSAKQLAARAARCALILRDALPGFSCAVATGRPDRVDSIGQIIARATDSKRSVAGEILVDPATASLIGERYLIDEGRLVEERTAAERSFELLGRASAFLGRDRELAFLDDVVDEVVSESRTRAVMITGPPGIGKSRLIEEFLARVGEQAVVARSIADPTGGDSYSLVVSMSLSLLSLEHDSPARQRRECLRKHWPQTTGHDAATRDALESLIAPTDAGGTEGSGIEGVRRGDLQRAAWITWIESIAGQGPVILAVEDLHWADAASVQLLGLLLRNLEDYPLMVIATSQRESDERAQSPWPAVPCDELWLGSLRSRAINTIVTRALGTEVSDELATDLRTRCGGNPFFLEELIRCIQSNQGAEMPESIAATIQARTASLPSGARRALRAGSVFGMSFSSKGLAAIARLPESEVETWLKLLDEGELVRRTARPSPLDCSFRHSTVREVMYSAMTQSDRAEAHLAAGNWLEAQGWCDAAVLAEHFHRSGHLERAAGHFLTAAQAALRGNDLATVVSLCQRGLSGHSPPSVRGGLNLVLSEALYWQGQDSRAALDDALALLPPGDASWYLASRLRAYASAVAGDQPGLETRGAQLLATFPSEGDLAFEAWQVALSAYAEALAHQGPLERIADFERHLEPPASPRAMAAHYSLLGIKAYVQGDWSGFASALHRAARAYREDSNMRGAVAALTNLGTIHLTTGCYPEAEQAAEGSLQSCRTAGIEILEHTARLIRAEARIRSGRLDQGIADAQELLSSASHSAMYLGQARELLALGLYFQGELAPAESSARTAATLLEGSPTLHRGAMGVLALILAGQGRFDEAVQISDCAMNVAGPPNPERDVLLFVGRTEALRGLGSDWAADVARTGAERVLERAAMIRSQETRRSFLERVWENARILRMCP